MKSISALLVLSSGRAPRASPLAARQLSRARQVGSENRGEVIVSVTPSARARVPPTSTPPTPPTPPLFTRHWAGLGAPTGHQASLPLPVAPSAATRRPASLPDAPHHSSPRVGLPAATCRRWTPPTGHPPNTSLPVTHPKIQWIEATHTPKPRASQEQTWGWALSGRNPGRSFLSHAPHGAAFTSPTM